MFEALPRRALHAKTLGFTHPGTGERMNFESELPEDMAKALAKWTTYIEASESAALQCRVIRFSCLFKLFHLSQGFSQRLSFLAFRSEPPRRRRRAR